MWFGEVMLLLRPPGVYPPRIGEKSGFVEVFGGTDATAKPVAIKRAGRGEVDFDALTFLAKHFGDDVAATVRGTRA